MNALPRSGKNTPVMAVANWVQVKGSLSMANTDEAEGDRKLDEDSTAAQGTDISDVTLRLVDFYSLNTSFN